jgi:hypothetical protein
MTGKISGKECTQVQERLACGEPVAALEAHLERCSDCTAFARDAAILRRAAAELPRPPAPRGPLTLAARPAVRTPGALVFVAASALLVLFVSLTLMTRLLVTRGPAQPAAAPRTTARSAAPDAVDLLSYLSQAERVWSPRSAGDSWAWLDLGVAKPATWPGRDPVASLRPVALLLENQSETTDSTNTKVMNTRSDSIKRRNP